MSLDGLSEADHDQVFKWLRGYQLLLMENYSEERWAAGWMHGLEEELWLLEAEPGPTIRGLAEWTDIWWVHDPRPDHPSRAAMPLAAWKRQMENRARGTV